MSAREKNLLTLFLVAGFFILNFFLYSLFIQKRAQLQNELSAAKSKLQQAIVFSESSAQIRNEIEWLAQHERNPAVYQDVQTELQQFAVNQAQTFGLTIKAQELLPTDESGVHFHRAQVKLNVTGEEQSLYRWFNAINDPDAFRATYQIRISPNAQNDTLIDCSATLAQWFPPAK